MVVPGKCLPEFHRQNTDPVRLKLESGTLFDSAQASPQCSSVLLGSTDDICSLDLRLLLLLT
jgi:hypothetical protein